MEICFVEGGGVRAAVMARRAHAEMRWLRDSMRDTHRVDMPSLRAASSIVMQLRCLNVVRGLGLRHDLNRDIDPFRA